MAATHQVRSRFFQVKAPVEGAKAVEGAPKVHTFVASDGDYDRYQDRISVSGWDLKAYCQNPVILFAHDDAGGIGGSKSLPIGKGRPYVSGDQLLVDMVFDQADDFAKQVEKKVEGGFLNTVSVRYLMLDYTDNDKGGFDCSKQELLEISVVVVPGNSRALVKKAMGPGLDVECEVCKAAGFVCAPPAKTAPPAPKVIELDPKDFVDAFSAAFAAKEQ